MTPTKTLYLNEVDAHKYIVSQDGSFLIVQGLGLTFILRQLLENEPIFIPTEAAGLQLENIQTIQVADDLVTFEFGGYNFEWNGEDEFTASEIPPEFAGTGELVSHNFGVDEVYLCDKINNLVWGTIGGQKVYFEQSAVGKYSTSTTKPQTAAEMGPPAIEASQNTNFMFAGYVFINEETNFYDCTPVPTSD